MHRLSRLALIAVVALATTGCTDPFTRENFNLIKVNVDARPDVEKLIGPPDSTYGNSDQWFYENDTTHAQALIDFGRDGKVEGKRWLEGDDNPLAGGNPHVAPRDGLKGDLKHVFGLD